MIRVNLNCDPLKIKIQEGKVMETTGRFPTRPFFTVFPSLVVTLTTF